MMWDSLRNMATQLLSLYLCLYVCTFTSLHAQEFQLSNFENQNSYQLLNKLDSQNKQLLTVLKNSNDSLLLLRTQLVDSRQLSAGLSIQLMTSQSTLTKLQDSQQKTSLLLNNSEKAFQEYKTEVSAEMSSLKKQRLLISVGLVLISGLLLVVVAR